MEWDRNSFVFYRSFREQIDLLPAEDQAEAYKAISDYGLYGKEYNGDNASIKLIMYGATPAIVTNYKKYIGGKTGGRPRKDEDVNVNVNDNDNVNVNEDVNVNGKIEPTENQRKTYKKPTKNLQTTKNNLKQPNEENERCDTFDGLVFKDGYFLASNLEYEE